jgi:hypothetical protein
VLWPLRAQPSRLCRVRGVGLLAKTCLLSALLGGCGRPPAPQDQAATKPSAEPAPNQTAPDAREAVAPVAPLDCLSLDEAWSAGKPTLCSATCRTETFHVSRCVPPRRTEHVVRAACACGPAVLGSELAGCRFDQIGLVPLEQVPAIADAVSPVDGCMLELSCGPGKLSIRCDGEEDGTGTSLCECSLSGQPLRLPRSGVWPGVGAETCHDAAALCLRVASLPSR